MDYNMHLILTITLSKLRHSGGLVKKTRITEYQKEYRLTITFIFLTFFWNKFLG